MAPAKIDILSDNDSAIKALGVAIEMMMSSLSDHAGVRPLSWICSSMRSTPVGSICGAGYHD